jgi:hypothetical protein
MKLRYVPLLMVYFSVGLTGLAAVTNTLFLKDQVSLTAANLVELGIWTGLPWSIKMVFGSLIDGIPIFGSNRKGYIYLGNFLILLGMLGMVDNASSKLLFTHLGEYGGLLLTGLLTSIGVVIADIVADTMAIEIVNEDKDLGMVQVLSRLFLSAGALVGASLTGLLAASFSPSVVYTIVIICPISSMLATAFVPLKGVSRGVLRKGVLFGGLGYGIFCMLSGYLFGEYAQMAVFIAAMLVLGAMFSNLLPSLKKDAIKPFILAMIAIFLFRIVPSIGPAQQWFYIESLGFDANFLGTLSLMAALASFVALWGLADSITSSSIFKTMAILVGLVTVLSLPDILVYYGIHEILGLSAKTLILADTAMIGPIGQLSMVPLGVLIAKNAPKNARAVYISLTASLMNIALVGGDIITKKLNDIFIVTRTDFSQLGNLMVISLTISTVLSIIGLIILKRSNQ